MNSSGIPTPTTSPLSLTANQQVSYGSSKEEEKEPQNNQSTVAALRRLTRIAASETYVSPYDLKQAPLDYIVIHNRSKNAANSAIRELKAAWPNLKIIQVVQEDRDPVPGADEVVRIKDWSSMDHFNAQFKQLAAKNAALRKSMEAGTVGFYSVWSAAAENSDWARSAQDAGFVWIGASPDRMKGLDKIEYKKLCQTHGLPTAPFIEIPAPQGLDKEAALRGMAEQLVKLYNETPALAGKAVFAKHNEGGGGRGSKKIAEMTFDNALEAIRKIVNETGGHLDGVYAELALDLEDGLLFQIEIEGDAAEVAHGGRLVWFNKENQKVLEVGFTDSSILQLLPKEVYEACRAASKKVFEASGYDNRGTNEILIQKNGQDEWQIYSSELNKRIQVEHEALSELVVDAKGRTKNVAAEQVMRSLGFPAPKASDFHEKGPAIVGHLRLLSCEITENGSKYPAGLEVDDAFYPQDANVQFVRGPVHLDADPQLGRALFTAETWEEFCDKLLQFSKEFQFHGPKTESSTYLEFFRKLASNPEFRAGKLGCNKTFEVLKNRPVEEGKVQKIVASLSETVTPVILEGYRSAQGVENQPYPTQKQIDRFKGYQAELQYKAPPETPFSRFIQHKKYETYVTELKAQLQQHGGGVVTVTRDVQQSQADQESALIQEATAKIAEVYFAASGVGVGFETGGAQYQAALMRGINWWKVLTAGCLSNLASHSLTRSAWMNGLDLKTPEEQAYIFKVISEEICRLYDFDPEASTYIPWFPNNFHAGNISDGTLERGLDAGIPMIPNFAWDPSFSDEDFAAWVEDKIAIFKEKEKPFDFIRIKNPGQNPRWNAETIVSRVQIIRELFKKHKLEEPIIYVHNHEIDGQAAHIASEALKRCQALGYRQLVLDVAPPGNSHNSSLIVSQALQMTEEERANLEKYNHVTQAALDLTQRFNNQALTREYQNPNSEMAAGTVSSDLASAKEQGIPLEEMSRVIHLAKRLTNLATAVTPYSEWIKQLGFAIYKNEGIQPKTLEAAEAYINNGGRLAIGDAILEGLRAWDVFSGASEAKEEEESGEESLPQRRKRPEIITKLLTNHGVPLQREKPPVPALDLKAVEADLQAKLPRTPVTSRDVATYLAFGKIGLNFLINRDRTQTTKGPKDLTPLMKSPEFVHSEFKKVGDSFLVDGEKVSIARIQPNKDKGTVDVDYLFRGHLVRTTGVDPNKLANAAIKEVRKVKDANSEVGAVMAGKLVRLFVKPGDQVKAGQVVAIEEAMKMEHSMRAARDGVVDYVRDIKDQDGILEEKEVIVALRM